jgi:hypothetical protein
MPTIQNPTVAQQQAQFNQTRAGRAEVNHGQDGHLWASGITEPEILAMLAIKFHNEFDRYFLYSFFRTMQGRSYPVANQDYGWYEQGRVRRGVTVVEPTAGFTFGGASLVIETGNEAPRYLVGQVLNFTNNGGYQARITATAMTGAAGTEALTLVKISGTNWTAGDVVDGQVVGHVFNAHAEGTGQPGSVTYRPEQYSNKLTRIKSTCKATGDAMTTKTWITDQTYLSVEEKLKFIEHIADIEHNLMFSRETPDGTPEMQGRGLFYDIIENSQAKTDYTGALSEGDLQAHIQTLMTLNPSYNYMQLCGSAYFMDAQRAFKEYVVQGGQLPSFAMPNSNLQGVGINLNVANYAFGGYQLALKHYRGFDDREVTGAPVSAASATDIDFSQLALTLNMDMGAGTSVGGYGSETEVPYLSFAYKAMGDINRSLVVGLQKGMTGAGSNSGYQIGDQSVANPQGVAAANVVSTDLDEDATYYLSQVGIRAIAVDTAHGLIRRVG